MTDLENLIVVEARKLGFAVTADAVMQSAIDLAGGGMTEQGYISLPGKGVLSPSNYVSALRAAMPTAFRPLDAEPEATPPGNLTLTEAMRREVAATRRKAALPDDWNAVRERYAAGSVTRKHMDEVAAARRLGK
ncbi:MULTISPECIES: hypothetical protein [unclassified Bradyrhizobium]|uniref:hypothetical protein n=1 Tax=unclassified Bradyrhizobium TaxID=2631580 RepID=UPI0029164442|nr:MULTISPECIES: hypothetical protein [unclassified Bradyrhizobium]